MKLKRLFVIPILLSICACSSGNDSKIKFSHQQGTSDYEDYCYYDDSIFDGDSTTFNPKLASASISFAMASFASMKESSYENKSINAKNFLTKIGFTDFTVNDWYKKKPESDSIGLLAAKKKIGEYTVVAISARGAAYFSEWASNFTLDNRDVMAIMLALEVLRTTILNLLNPIFRIKTSKAILKFGQPDILELAQHAIWLLDY